VKGFPFPSTAAFVVLLSFIAAPVAARGECGDAVLESGEECDDGNVLDGDCCSASCTYEAVGVLCDHGQQGVCFEALQGSCDGAGTCRPRYCDPLYYAASGMAFRITDRAGEDHDSLTWNLLGGQYASDTAPGDPTLDTDYALCIFDMAPDTSGTDYAANLRYEKVFPAGEGWRKTSTGYQYKLSEPAGGSARVRVQEIKKVLLQGPAAQLPGPVSAEAYFDGTIQFGLVSSAASYCKLWSGFFSPGPNNSPTHMKFRARFFQD